MTHVIKNTGIKTLVLFFAFSPAVR
ncbi:MAG: hypothetical protein LBB59_03390 [Campylobacteraceae bacterium]|nr:hypothetical protein [Campylobacteraceae bacterium]